jgi:hypothetical protein
MIVLWIIVWILWTLIVLGAGLGAGMSYEKDKEKPVYQDGKPIQTFYYNIPISDEDATDKGRLDVLWDWYKTETYVKGKPRG